MPKSRRGAAISTSSPSENSARIARPEPGVVQNVGIADEIDVSLTSETVTTDEEISQRIAPSLEWNTQIPTVEVEAKVRNSVETLSEPGTRISDVVTPMGKTKGFRALSQ